MYVRIARFEGGGSDWDERIAQIGDAVRSGGQGTPLAAASDAIQRMIPSVRPAAHARSVRLQRRRCDYDPITADYETTRQRHIQDMLGVLATTWIDLRGRQRGCGLSEQSGCGSSSALRRISRPGTRVALPTSIR